MGHLAFRRQPTIHRRGSASQELAASPDVFERGRRGESMNTCRKSGSAWGFALVLSFGAALAAADRGTARVASRVAHAKGCCIVTIADETSRNGILSAW